MHSLQIVLPIRRRQPLFSRGRRMTNLKLLALRQRQMVLAPTCTASLRETASRHPAWLDSFRQRANPFGNDVAQHLLVCPLVTTDAAVAPWYKSQRKRCRSPRLQTPPASLCGDDTAKSSNLSCDPKFHTWRRRSRGSNIATLIERGWRVAEIGNGVARWRS